MRIEEHVLGEIYARRYPAQDARYALIIAHGFGGHGSMYDLFGTHHSSKGVDIWSYDAPGHGKSTSTRPRGQFTMQEWVDASLTYADHVRQETGLPVFLLGSSLGVAASYCALASDAVSGAILMGAPLIPGTPAIERMAGPYRTEAASQIAAQFGRALRLDVATFINYDEDYGYAGAADQKRLDPWTTWSYEFASLLSVFTYEPAIAPKENAKPVLVASGANDAMFPEAVMREAVEAIGGPVEYKLFPDGSHQLLMFETEKFSCVVDEFVEKHLE